MTRILYAEDEPFLGKIVKESLESRDFEVRLVADGNEVMKVFERFQPDVCVLDVMLPNLDGFSLGQAIRQKRNDIPILFLTARNQTEDVVKGFESGGNDYVRKPFSMEELIVRIRNLLQLANKAPKDSTLQEGIPIGKYRFYPTRQSLEYGGESRQLSHREAHLLEILSGMPNQAVERKFILQQIWGSDSFFNSRNLDVYIKKLRDYLSADEQVQILTLKGVGYRLIC